jgi:hypothetical protein
LILRGPDPLDQDAEHLERNLGHLRGLPVAQVRKDFERVAPGSDRAKSQRFFDVLHDAGTFEEFQNPEGDSLISGHAIQVGGAKEAVCQSVRSRQLLVGDHPIPELVDAAARFALQNFRRLVRAQMRRNSKRGNDGAFGLAAEMILDRRRCFIAM